EPAPRHPAGRQRRRPALRPHRQRVRYARRDRRQQPRAGAGAVADRRVRPVRHADLQDDQRVSRRPDRHGDRFRQYRAADAGRARLLRGLAVHAGIAAAVPGQPRAGGVRPLLPRRARIRRVRHGAGAAQHHHADVGVGQDQELCRVRRLQRRRDRPAE
ncbi:hypothetical protein LTR94_032476, partial [Friedmanniomyces endolithicus]